jgi:hypothetical protein
MLITHQHCISALTVVEQVANIVQMAVTLRQPDTMTTATKGAVLQNI